MALLPQEEVLVEGEQIEPGGFNAVVLPFADEVREPKAAPSAAAAAAAESADGVKIEGMGRAFCGKELRGVCDMMWRLGRFRYFLLTTGSDVLFQQQQQHHHQYRTYLVKSELSRRRDSMDMALQQLDRFCHVNMPVISRNGMVLGMVLAHDKHMRSRYNTFVTSCCTAPKLFAPTAGAVHSAVPHG